MINVLVANVNTLWQDNAAVEAALHTLPQVMQDGIAQYKIRRDRLLRLTGKILLQELLKQHGGGYTLADVQRNESNRPYIPDSGIDFSISHSGKIAVCALSTEGNLGIDIEKVIPMGWRYFEPLFEPWDWAYAMQHRRRQYSLFQLWTQREACIKAMDEYPFTEEPFSFEGWHLERLYPDLTDLHRYVAIVATRFESEISVADLNSDFQQTIRDTE